MDSDPRILSGTENRETWAPSAYDPAKHRDNCAYALDRLLIDYPVIYSCCQHNGLVTAKDHCLFPPASKSQAVFVCFLLSVQK